MNKIRRNPSDKDTSGGQKSPVLVGPVNEQVTDNNKDKKAKKDKSEDKKHKKSVKSDKEKDKDTKCAEKRPSSSLMPTILETNVVEAVAVAVNVEAGAELASDIEPSSKKKKKSKKSDRDEDKLDEDGKEKRKKHKKSKKSHKSHKSKSKERECEPAVGGGGGGRSDVLITQVPQVAF